jgi:hypothetical protein
MKIRIKDNSVRFRLTKSEVKQLCEEKLISSATSFNKASLIYAIEVRENITELSADFENNKITLFFPATEATTWYESDLITYQNNMLLDNGIALKLLLEKDFVCLDHSDEDQSDNYENPGKVC